MKITIEVHEDKPMAPEYLEKVAGKRVKDICPGDVLYSFTGDEYVVVHRGDYEKHWRK